MFSKNMSHKATLHTGTYSIKHVSTGQYVALKDTKRKSTLIPLQDGHFEHLSVSVRWLHGYLQCTHVTLIIVGPGKAKRI